MSGEEEAQEEVPETPSLRNSLVSSGEGSCVDAYGIGCLELGNTIALYSNHCSGCGRRPSFGGAS